MSVKTQDEAQENRAQVTPASWLAQARAQSAELANLRHRRLRPFRRPEVRRSRVDRLLARPFALVLASALLLLSIASGAWAIAVHGRKTLEDSPRLAPGIESLSAPARRWGPPVPPTVPLAPPPPPARAHDRSTARDPVRVVRVPPAATTQPPPEFDEADGDLILVLPHQKQPPLFTPEEWKRQR